MRKMIRAFDQKLEAIAFHRLTFWFFIVLGIFSITCFITMFLNISVSDPDFYLAVAMGFLLAPYFSLTANILLMGLSNLIKRFV